ncbi:glycosyltransferase [Sphingomonas panni]
MLANPFSTPLTVDSAAARRRLLDDLGVEDARIVGFVGNMWKRKRPEMFVDIAQRLAATDPDLRFVLFGRDGDVTSDQMRAKIAAAGLTDRFLLAGFRLPPEARSCRARPAAYARARRAVRADPSGGAAARHPLCRGR